MREKGCLLLPSDLKNSKKTTANGFFFYWNQREYYFKEELDIQQRYNELFFSQIALLLNIPTVQYDLAKYNDKVGVISENYNPNNQNEIPIYNVLSKYYDEIIIENADLFPDEIFIQNAFNLEDVWEALRYYYQEKENRYEIVAHLMNQIVERFLLQIVTLNIDLHFYNMSILDGKIPTLTPNYDYGRCNQVSFENDSGTYFFSAVPFKLAEKKKSKTTIVNFLNISDQSFVDKLTSYAQTILSMPIEIIFSEIEKKTEFPIPESFKDNILRNYLENVKIIMDIIEEQKIEKRK